MSDARGKGKLELFLVLAVFAAPVVLGYLVYYFFPPEGGKLNYGELLTPQPLPAGGVLQDGAGKNVPLADLRGRWWLVYAAPQGCDAACEGALDVMRRVRLLQGRDQDRVGRLLLLRTVSPARMSVPDLRTLGDTAGTMFARLPGAGQHIYLVDPLGNVMMRWPLAPDVKAMSKDLARLLRASQIG